MTPEDIVEAFANAGETLPRDALQQATEHWDSVAPILLALLDDVADGVPIQDRNGDILLFAVYLMAQQRDTRAYRPLCAIAADGDRMEQLLGDGFTEDGAVILARVYDGDPAPIRALIEATEADEFARATGFGALAWLTVTGRIDRADTASYLQALHATLQPQGESAIWFNWQEAIAYLGLEELRPLVADVFKRRWIDKRIMEYRHFEQDIRAVQRAADPAAIFPHTIRDDGRFDDVAAFMATWDGYHSGATGGVTAAPIHNPYRNVGRNDPCPCGSGRKFKKCCLGKAA